MTRIMVYPTYSGTYMMAPSLTHIYSIHRSFIWVWGFLEKEFLLEFNTPFILNVNVPSVRWFFIHIKLKAIMYFGCIILTEAAMLWSSTLLCIIVHFIVQCWEMSICCVCRQKRRRFLHDFLCENQTSYTDKWILTACCS